MVGARPQPPHGRFSSPGKAPFHHPARGVAEKLERPGKVGRSEPTEAGFTGGLPRICRDPRSFCHAIPMHIPERHFSAGLLGAWVPKLLSAWLPRPLKDPHRGLLKAPVRLRGGECNLHYLQSHKREVKPGLRQDESLLAHFSSTIPPRAAWPFPSVRSPIRPEPPRGPQAGSALLEGQSALLRCSRRLSRALRRPSPRHRG